MYWKIWISIKAHHSGIGSGHISHWISTINWIELKWELSQRIMNLRVLSWHYEAFYNTKIHINFVSFESKVVLLIYTLWATLSMNCQLSHLPSIMLVKNHSIIVSERVTSIFKACPKDWNAGKLFYVSEFCRLFDLFLKRHVVADNFCPKSFW